MRAIDGAVYPVTWSERTWRAEIDADDRVHLVALADGRVIGHAGLLVIVDEAHITTVAVDPQHQGRGVATRLLVGLFDRARAWPGVDHVTLEVRASDHRTQRLYGRFGLAPAGLRTGYYQQPADDAVIMWAHDVGGAEIARRLDELRSGL